MSQLVETLNAPLRKGYAQVALHLESQVLPGTMPPNSKRRIRHTFYVRDHDRIVKFDVLTRAFLLPRQVSVADVEEMAREETESGIIEAAEEAAAEEVGVEHPQFEQVSVAIVQRMIAEPRYEELVQRVVRRLVTSFRRDGVVVR
jgi:hypothetical protein